MLYPVIGLPPFEAGGDQVNCTPLPLAGPAVRFCGAEGVVVPCAVAVAVLVAVAVGSGVFVATGVLVGVFEACGVAVAVLVAVAVAVGVGALPQEANLKLPMR